MPVTPVTQVVIVSVSAFASVVVFVLARSRIVEKLWGNKRVSSLKCELGLRVWRFCNDIPMRTIFLGISTFASNMGWKRRLTGTASVARWLKGGFH